MTTRSGSPVAPGRAMELDERMARIEELTAHLAHQLDLQFKRIAQLQAEVDEMRAASANVERFRRRVTKSEY